MAILTGVNSKLRGSIGNITYQRINGQTVAKEKVEKKATPRRTLAQMRKRMAWANIVHIWQSFKGDLHPSFEGKDRRSTDFNEFMSANLAGSGVYLTKNESMQGGAVVEAYQVTRGSIPSVGVAFGENGVPVTDIAVGDLAFGASTTLRRFSQAIINNNRNWEYGDQLTVFIARQTVNSTTGIPLVNIEAVEITLGDSDVQLIGDLVDVDLFVVNDGYLGLAGTVNGGVAVIHSRKTQGETRVSTQFFVVSNPLLVQYQSSTAFETAVNSYGGINSEEFLTPGTGVDLVITG